MRRSALLVRAALAFVAAIVVALSLPAVALAATPSQVTGLRVAATADPSMAALKWNSAKYATSYYVYRAPFGSTTWTKVASVKSRSYAIPTAAGTRFSYKVRAYSSRYRKYGAYSGLITPQPEDLSGLVGDTSGSLAWSETGGADHYKITVTVGETEPLQCSVIDAQADFSAFVPLFADPGVVFEVTPVSVAGVEGVSAFYYSTGTAPLKTVSGQGPVASIVAGTLPGTYVMSVSDTDSGVSYTVVLDGSSTLDAGDGTGMTPDEFAAALAGAPGTDVAFELVADPDKTTGSGADFYVTFAAIVLDAGI